MPISKESGSYNNMGRIVLIYFIGSLAGLLFGMDTGIISGALPFLSKQFNIGTFQQSYVW